MIICQDRINQLERQGTMLTSEVVIESERMIQVALQGREGGEREVETPAGFVDLLTDEYVIEVKHVSDWKDAAKVVLLAQYFNGKKPRVHLFGSYAADFRALVEKCYAGVNILVTWERALPVPR
jgi:hypothetical protein